MRNNMEYDNIRNNMKCEIIQNNKKYYEIILNL